METTKTCTKCGEVKELGEFYRDRQKSSGVLSRCKECTRRYQTKNPDAKAERQRRYRAENPKAVAERQRRYRAETREALRERERRNYAKNAQAVAKRVRNHRVKNAEAITARERNRRVKNVKLLTAGYVREILCAGPNGTKPDQITDDLIILKRNQLRILRAANAALTHLKGKS